MKEIELISLPFDTYTRYKITTDIINRISKEFNSLKVLDVGGRGGLSHQFFKNTVGFILDIRKPENDFDENLLRNKKYFIGDILNNSFANDFFDISISLDVYEHLKPEDRIKSVEKMLRISKLGIIIGAPFDSPVTNSIEKNLNGFYRELMGHEHYWLKEHIENRPLPSSIELDNYLNKNNLFFKRVGNNNILLWSILQYLVFMAEKNNLDVSNVHRFYNTNLTKIGDDIPPVYRFIYFITKNESILEKFDISEYFKTDKKEVDIVRCELFENTFKTINQNLLIGNKKLLDQLEKIHNSFSYKVYKNIKGIIKR